MLFLGKPMRCFHLSCNDCSQCEKDKHCAEQSGIQHGYKVYFKTEDVGYSLGFWDQRMSSAYLSTHQQTNNRKKLSRGWTGLALSRRFEKYNQDPRIKFDLNSAVPKRKFKNQRIKQNNQFAFLLTDATEDKNL